MIERCPDFFPDYLTEPEEEARDDYTYKLYEDGVVAVIGPPSSAGRLFSDGYVETRFTDGSMHYERGYGGLPEFYPDGHPEDVIT